MHRHIFLVLLLAAPTIGASQTADLRTAAGCGPLKTQFEVKTNSKQHAVTQPESGKALVYVVTEERSDPHSMQIGHVTTRVGLDGNWVGANHGRSYISFAAEPGEHRLCTDWQSSLKAIQKLNAAADLMAEAGKTYYYRMEVTIPWKDHPAEVWLKAADEAEGLLLVSDSAASTWKVKK